MLLQVVEEMCAEMESEQRHQLGANKCITLQGRIAEGRNGALRDEGGQMSGQEANLSKNPMHCPVWRSVECVDSDRIVCESGCRGVTSKPHCFGIFGLLAHDFYALGRVPLYPRF